MFIVEITEDKFSKMAEYAEKMLKYGGKLMSCISEVGDEYGMSFREPYDHINYRGGQSNRGRSMGRDGRMNYRDDDEWEEEEMGERRGRRRRDSMGRYM